MNVEPTVAPSVLTPGDPRWTSFVEHHADASVFNQSAWAQVLVDCYGFRSYVIALMDESGLVRAGLPVMDVSLRGQGRRWVSLPFSDECQPLVSDGYDLSRLTMELDELRRRARVPSVLVRGLLRGAGAQSGVVATRHVLALDDGIEAVRSRYRKQARTNVRRAHRQPLRVRIGVRRQDLTEVYFALHLATRHRLGIPPQPKRYFSCLWESLLEPGHGFVALVERGSSVLAGAVFLRSHQTLFYKYGASNDEGRALRASFALVDEVLERASTEGFRRLEFGRTDLPDAGLSRFKENWGAVGTPLVYSVLADHPGVPRPSTLNPKIRSAVSRAPVRLSTLVGEYFYKYQA